MHALHCSSFQKNIDFEISCQSCFGCLINMMHHTAIKQLSGCFGHHIQLTPHTGSLYLLQACAATPSKIWPPTTPTSPPTPVPLSPPMVSALHLLVQLC